MTATAGVLTHGLAAGSESNLELRSRARRAGLLYAGGCIAAPFALLYVPKVVFVSGDAAATADRIRGARGLVELGMAAELFTCSLIVIALIALYRLFRDVSQPLATAMVALFFVAVPLQLANLLNTSAALMLTSGTSMLATFSKEQLDALAYMFMRLHSRGIDIAQIYWGLWLIPYGLVVKRSGFIPGWIGIPLIIAGLGYVMISVVSLFFPQYSALLPFLFVLGAGEFPILVWLIGWGARKDWAQA